MPIRITREDVQLEPIDVADLVQDLLLLTPTLQDDVVIVPFSTDSPYEPTYLPDSFSSFCVIVTVGVLTPAAWWTSYCQVPVRSGAAGLSWAVGDGTSSATATSVRRVLYMDDVPRASKAPGLRPSA